MLVYQGIEETQDQPDLMDSQERLVPWVMLVVQDRRV